MRKVIGTLLVVLAAIGGSAPPADAQTTTPAAATPRVVTLYELALRDGSRLYGAVVRQDELEVVFRTESGTTVTVKRDEILTLRQMSGVMLDGQFQPADLNATRLFFGPTGRSLKRGQIYLGVYEIVLPFVQVGVTDRISIGGGTPLMFGGGESGRPFWITPKVQLISGPKTQVSVGAFHGFSGGDGGEYGGIAYVVGTRGNTASSFTIGAGVAYSGGGDRAPVVMVGGERQFRRNMKFVTENYLWKGGEGVVTGGVRFFGERLSADLALALPITDSFFIFPVVNFVYIF